MLKMRHLQRKIGLWHFDLHPRFRRVWGLHLSVEGGHAQNCGENGFFRFAVSKFRWKGPKPGTWKNGKIYLCWRAPSHFVRFGGAPGFRQKRVFENRQIFAETTENVVRNGRGSKTHFCTVGFEIGHLRSGSNIVPKYFSLNWHFLSHSPSRRQGELFYFSCRFPFLSTGPFLYFSWLHFVSATTSAICPFCCVSFLLFSLVVFVFFVGVSASDSTSSFLSLSWVLSSCFFVLFSFFFLRSMFFLPVVCLSYPLPVFPSLKFLSVTRPYLVLMFPFVLCFHFVSRLIFFCFVFFLLVPPLSHLLSFLLPRPPRALEKEHQWKEQLSHFVCLSGIFAKMSFAQSNCLFIFLVDIFLFTEHVFVRYSWNMFWGSKGLFVASYLLLYRCFGVWCRAVLLANLSLVPTFLGIRSVLCSCFFLGGASASFEFCWGLFFLILLIFLILGSFYFAAVWSCWFFYFMSWLVVCASRFRCCHFVVNLVGGLVGRANREGSIYFWPFFIIGVFGRKQSLPPRARVFLHGFGFEIGHGRVQKTIAFSLLSHETL